MLLLINKLYNSQLLGEENQSTKKRYELPKKSVTVLGTNDSHSCVLTRWPVFPKHLYFRFWIKMYRIGTLGAFSISLFYFASIYIEHFSIATIALTIAYQ